MKKFLSIILVFAFMFVLTGCNQSSGSLANNLEKSIDRLKSVMDKTTDVSNEDLVLNDIISLSELENKYNLSKDNNQKTIADPVSNKSTTNKSKTVNQDSKSDKFPLPNLNRQIVRRNSKTNTALDLISKDQKIFQNEDTEKVTPNRLTNRRASNSSRLTNSYYVPRRVSEVNYNNTNFNNYLGKLEDLYLMMNDAVCANQNINSCKNSISECCDTLDVLCGQIKSNEIKLTDEQINSCNDLLAELGNWTNKTSSTRNDVKNECAGIKQSGRNVNYNVDRLSTNYVKLINCLDERESCYSNMLSCLQQLQCILTGNCYKNIVDENNQEENKEIKNLLNNENFNLDEINQQSEINDNKINSQNDINTDNLNQNTTMRKTPSTYPRDRDGRLVKTYPRVTRDPNIRHLPNETNERNNTTNNLQNNEIENRNKTNLTENRDLNKGINNSINNQTRTNNNNNINNTNNNSITNNQTKNDANNRNTINNKQDNINRPQNTIDSKTRTDTTINNNKNDSTQTQNGISNIDTYMQPTFPGLNRNTNIPNVNNPNINNTVNPNRNLPNAPIINNGINNPNVVNPNIANPSVVAPNIVNPNGVVPNNINNPANVVAPINNLSGVGGVVNGVVPNAPVVNGAIPYGTGVGIGNGIGRGYNGVHTYENGITNPYRNTDTYKLNIGDKPLPSETRRNFKPFTEINQNNENNKIKETKVS